jgi:hypothetical protein
MEQDPEDKDQVPAEAWDADAVKVKARDVEQAKVWVEWAALAQVLAQVDNVSVLHAELPLRIKSACPVITSVVQNAVLK